MDKWNLVGYGHVIIQMADISTLMQSHEKSVL